MIIISYNKGIKSLPYNAPIPLGYTTKICTTQNLLRSTAYGPLWPAYILWCGPFLSIMS